MAKKVAEKVEAVQDAMAEMKQGASSTRTASKRRRGSHDDLRHPRWRSIASLPAAAPGKPLIPLPTQPNITCILTEDEIRAGPTQIGMSGPSLIAIDQDSRGFTISQGDGGRLANHASITDRLSTIQGNRWTSRLAFPAWATFGLRAAIFLPNRE